MFRLELDALNALVKEQRRTNELLEQLIEGKKNDEKPAVTQIKSAKTAAKRQPRRKVSG